MKPNLDDIRRLRAGITKPPWGALRSSPDNWILVKMHETDPSGPHTYLPIGKKANALFLADAPTIIDALLTYIEELEAERKERT